MNPYKIPVGTEICVRGKIGRLRWPGHTTEYSFEGLPDWLNPNSLYIGNNGIVAIDFTKDLVYTDCWITREEFYKRHPIELKQGMHVRYGRDEGRIIALKGDNVYIMNNGITHYRRRPDSIYADKAWVGREVYINGVVYRVQVWDYAHDMYHLNDGIWTGGMTLCLC